jgi:hypothetical protein
MVRAKKVNPLNQNPLNQNPSNQQQGVGTNPTYDQYTQLTRSLPFALTAEIPYRLSVAYYPLLPISPVTRFFSFDVAKQSSKTKNNPDDIQEMNSYETRIEIGGSHKIYGTKTYSELPLHEQNLILAHELLHVLLTWHPEIVEITKKMDAFDGDTSNAINDLIIDYFSSLFRHHNYLFRAMIGGENILLFHYKTYTKGVNEFGVKSSRYLYLVENMLDKTKVKPLEPGRLDQLADDGAMTPEIRAAYDTFLDGLRDVGKWMNDTDYDFLSDPFLATNTEFIQKLKVVEEKLLEVLKKEENLFHQPQMTHGDDSFTPSTNRDDVNSGKAKVSKSKEKTTPIPENSREVMTGDLDVDKIKEKEDEIKEKVEAGLNQADKNKSEDNSSGLHGGDELQIEEIKESLLSETRRELVSIMSESLRMRTVDPTGIVGTSLINSDSGSFHFNVNGAIQAVQKNEHPQLFRTLQATNIQKKTILLISDCSISMDEFNRTVKPWFSALMVSNLRTFYRMNVIDFGGVVVKETLPYNKMASGFVGGSGTDPFGYDAGVIGRGLWWKNQIATIKPNDIIFLSDFEYHDPIMVSIDLYNVKSNDELKYRAWLYLSQRFATFGFRGNIYPINTKYLQQKRMNDTSRFEVKTLEKTKNDVKDVLRSILDDRPYSHAQPIRATESMERNEELER